MKSLILLIFLSLPVVGVAQNLVPNPGFEEYTACPGYYSQDPAEFRATGWRSATAGTPDHFHACSNGEADVPHNWAGVADSFDGQGYAGIYVWMDNGRNYREYLQCQLLAPLIRDTTYVIEFHFKHASYSRYAIDRIGLLLSDSMINLKHDRVLKVQPTVFFVKDSALTEKTGYWEKAQFEYSARGDEQYLTIGNFSSDQETKYYKIKFQPDQQEMLTRSAYYYVDGVKILPKYLPMEWVDEIPPDFTIAAELNKSYVLRNIQFEFDSYRLKPNSFYELDLLVNWLKLHPQARVVLSGHTDDVGGDRYNMSLSGNRAKSVARYLIAQGIVEKRIKTAAYGKQRPVVRDTTEEARSLNRRVEVEFVE